MILFVFLFLLVLAVGVIVTTLRKGSPRRDTWDGGDASPVWLPGATDATSPPTSDGSHDACDHAGGTDGCGCDAGGDGGGGGGGGD